MNIPENLTQTPLKNYSFSVPHSLSWTVGEYGSQNEYNKKRK